MPSIAGGSEISSDVPYSNTSNIVANEVVDENAALKGAAGVIIPAVQDAYRAKQDAGLSGGNSVEDVFANPGSDKPQDSDLTDLTKISQAFADGHIGRQDAQLKVLSLVKQAGVNNPGEASKFRKEAARFFQGAFGGGPNPFGGLSADEKGQAKLIAQRNKFYLDYDLGKLGWGGITMIPGEIGERARRQIDIIHQQQSVTDDLNNRTARLNAQSDLTEAQKRAKVVQYNSQREALLEDVINNTNDHVNVVIDGLLEKSGGKFGPEEQAIAINAMDSALIKVENLINTGTYTLSPERKKELLDKMSHFKKFRSKIDGSDATALNNARIAFNKSSAALEVGNSLGWVNMHLLSVPGREVVQGLLNDAIRNPNGDAAKYFKNTGVLLNQALQGTLQDNPANSTPMVDVSSIRVLAKELEVSTNNPEESNFTPDQVKPQVDAIVKRLAGQGIVPSPDKMKVLQEWDQGLITLTQMQQEGATSPAMQYLRDKLASDEGDGLIRRIQSEFINPLNDAVQELFASKTIVIDEGGGVTSELPASEYVRLLPHEDGVKAEFIPETAAQLSAEQHASMGELITKFNAQLNPRFRLAFDTIHRVGTGNWTEHAPFERFKAAADGFTERLNLAPAGTAAMDIPDESTTSSLDSLRKIEESNFFGRGNIKFALSKAKAEQDAEIRRTVVKRDKDTGKTKSYKVQRSSTADAAARAADYRKGEVTEHPYGEVTTGPGAITYVFQAKPDMFQSLGIPQEYLEKLALVESGMRPEIKATTSSATGLFQFVDKTWDSLVQRYGHKHNITGDMRTDPVASTLMLGEMIGESLPSIKRVIGKRDPEMWELYSYHIFGPSKGRQFIRASDLNKTSEILPEKWIKANANLLEGKTIGQVRAYFKDKFS